MGVFTRVFAKRSSGSFVHDGAREARRLRRSGDAEIRHTFVWARGLSGKALTVILRYLPKLLASYRVTALSGFMELIGSSQTKARGLICYTLKS